MTKESGEISNLSGVQQRIRVAWGPIVAIILLVTAIGGIEGLHQPRATSVGGSFELINTKTGSRLTDRDFQGKWLLVLFGYTHCPDVCPTTLGEIADAMVRLGPLADRVQPLFITRDPMHDTSQILADYAAAFDRRIIALTGSPDQIAATAIAYKIYFAKRMAGDDYYVDHTAVVHLMRPDGAHEASFLSTSDSAEMVRSLRSLLKTDPPGDVR